MQLCTRSTSLLSVYNIIVSIILQLVFQLPKIPQLLMAVFEMAITDMLNLPIIIIEILVFLSFEVLKSLSFIYFSRKSLQNNIFS